MNTTKSEEETNKQQPLRKRPMISIRVAFIGLTTFFMALSGIFIIVISYQGSRSAIFNLTSQLMDKTSGDVSRQTESYFNTSIKALRTFESGVHNLGLLQAGNNQEQTLSYLVDIAAANPEISAIYFGEETTGNFYMAKRMPDLTISRRYITRTAEAVTVYWYHETLAYEQTFSAKQVFSLVEGYDPRKRSWYKLALPTSDFIWTDPYVFASDQSVGISVARKLFKEKTPRNVDSFLGVIAVDFSLQTIANFLSEIKLLKSTELTNAEASAILQKPYIVISDNKTRILATSDTNAPAFSTTLDEQNKKQYSLFTIENIPNNLIQQAYAQFEAQLLGETSSFNLYTAIRNLVTPRSEQLAADTNLKAVSIDFQNNKYLVTFNNFSLSNGSLLKVGIILRESLVTGAVSRALNIILLVSFILTFLIIIVSLRILRNITTPIVELARDMEKVRTFEIEVDNSVQKKQNFLREINEMYSSYNSMKSGLNSFKKFVPSEVVAQLIKLGKEANISGEKLDITIFFSDIEQFTVISEETPSEQLIAQLRYYLNLLSNGIADKGGTLDKYIGDSIMAFWGAPLVDKHHALNACSAALHCQKLVKKINKKFENAGLYPMRTRIGLHSGHAIVGNIGSDARLNYTALGDNVNLASRLEGLNKLYNTAIIISEETYNRTRQVVLARLIDKVAVYGKRKSVAAYELINFIDEVPLQEHEFYSLYSEGINYYFNRSWNKAIKVFKACLVEREKDGPSKVLLERCHYYAKSAPAEEWDGVFTAVSK